MREEGEHCQRLCALRASGLWLLGERGKLCFMKDEGMKRTRGMSTNTFNC